MNERLVELKTVDLTPSTIGTFKIGESYDGGRVVVVFDTKMVVAYTDGGGGDEPKKRKKVILSPEKAKILD